MGHRALVAAARANGRYDLYGSQWGAHEWRLATTLAGGVTVERVGPFTPVATDCSFEAVVAEHVDFQTHEALFVVTSEHVRPYLVCWFGLPGVDATGPRPGALVGVDADRPTADGEYLRGLFTGAKRTLVGLVADGRLDPATARAALVLRVASLAEERPVHFGPVTDRHGT